MELLPGQVFDFRLGLSVSLRLGLSIDLKLRLPGAVDFGELF